MKRRYSFLSLSCLTRGDNCNTPFADILSFPVVVAEREKVVSLPFSPPPVPEAVSPSLFFFFFPFPFTVTYIVVLAFLLCFVLFVRKKKGCVSLFFPPFFHLRIRMDYTGPLSSPSLPCIIGLATGPVPFPPLFRPFL